MPLSKNSGSGFIIKPDGLIVTNAHVVQGISTVEVTMQDGTKYQGRVEHLDPVADLATIRINAVRTRASLVIYVTINKYENLLSYYRKICRCYLSATRRTCDRAST